MDANSKHYRSLERMYLSAPINLFYRPTIMVSRGSAEISLEVRPDFYHAAEAVHGSVYFKMLDDASFFAANSLVDGVFVLTASYNIYLLRPITKGVITSTGRVVSRSRRVLVAEATLTDQDGKELARGSGTFMKSDIRLTAEIGYRPQPS